MLLYGLDNLFGFLFLKVRHLWVRYIMRKASPEIYAVLIDCSAHVPAPALSLYSVDPAPHLGKSLAQPI